MPILRDCLLLLLKLGAAGAFLLGSFELAYAAKTTLRIDVVKGVDMLNDGKLMRAFGLHCWLSIPGEETLPAGARQ